MSKKTKHPKIEALFSEEEIIAILEAGQMAVDKLSEEDTRKVCHMIRDLEDHCQQLAIQTFVLHAIEEARAQGLSHGEMDIDPGYMFHFTGHFFLQLGMGLACQLEVKP